LTFARGLPPELAASLSLMLMLMLMLFMMLIYTLVEKTFIYPIDGVSGNAVNYCFAPDFIFSV
jgi:hypothetical protein